MSAFTTLNIIEVKGRNKFAIANGNGFVIRKFKTLEAAKKELAEKRSFYEYWAGSIGACTQSKGFVRVII
jgi:hypothetical protein